MELELILAVVAGLGWALATVFGIALRRTERERVALVRSNAGLRAGLVETSGREVTNLRAVRDKLHARRVLREQQREAESAT
jgi:hypothetical protein